jgi:excisionase family DNA binding protein
VAHDLSALLPLLDALADALADRVAERLNDVPRKTAAPRGPLVSKQGLATALGVSTATVDRMAKDGAIPYVLVGEVRRFDLDEVRAALVARTPKVHPRQPVAAEEVPPSPVDLVRYSKRRRRTA